MSRTRTLCQSDRMALLHRATLTPPKLELVAGWLPSQPFGRAVEAEHIERIAAFRFDDPAGEVGIETLLVGAGDRVLQIPLTYRNAPLDGAEPWLIGTMEHSVLGTRWVYDAVGDPVYLAELVRVIATGDGEVEQHYEENGVRITKEPDARVHGSGHPGADVPAVGAVDVSVVRVVGEASDDAGAATLRGTWEGTVDALLATVRTR